MSKVIVEAWRCDRKGCGHIWIGFGAEPPAACAKCKSRSWNKETAGGAAPPDKTVAGGADFVYPPVAAVPVKEGKREAVCSSCGAVGGSHFKGCPKTRVQ